MLQALNGAGLNFNHASEQPGQNDAVMLPSDYYQPQRLTHVTGLHADGTVDLAVIIYLPPHYLYQAKPEADQVDGAVQVKVGWNTWQSLQLANPDSLYWTLDLVGLQPGTSLQFRYQDSEGTWKALAPLTALESVYETSYIPDLSYQWQHGHPTLDHARVLMETTLEGLLTGYKGGKFAPKSREEMFQASIAQRILKTDIPGRLADLGIDELMVPVSASIADRSHLDPKFNYLTYNIAELDWQMGKTAEFMELMDVLFEKNILLVPDLIFAHQVRAPFLGSLDQVTRNDDGEKLWVDRNAYLFRDYGTWMLKLQDAEIRHQVIEKIVAFVNQFHFKIIRIDYVDGLILQYSNRETNYSELFIQDLKAKLLQSMPHIIVLGETFEVAGNPKVQDFIDVFYAPIGFSIVEELYKPAAKMKRPLHPELGRLVNEINYVSTSARPEAIYAQLHDETWYCQHILAGRPNVPWAYGGNPAELAKARGEGLIRMGLLQPTELLDFVRRTVRNAEALTLFTAKLRYMYLPSVDSLALGCLDEGDHWTVVWEGVTPQQIQFWKKTGLVETTILYLQEQHRADMVRLRNIFRRYTHVDPDTLKSAVELQVFHQDEEESLLGLLRLNTFFRGDSLIVFFNFGPTHFREHHYELPVPDGFEGRWEVLFDGDGMSVHPDAESKGYSPGTILDTASGAYSNRSAVLRLEIGAMSLMVLRYCHDRLDP